MSSDLVREAARRAVHKRDHVCEGGGHCVEVLYSGDYACVICHCCEYETEWVLNKDHGCEKLCQEHHDQAA